jgi:hypothetical protein
MKPRAVKTVATCGRDCDLWSMPAIESAAVSARTRRSRRPGRHLRPTAPPLGSCWTTRSTPTPPPHRRQPHRATTVTARRHDQVGASGAGTAELVGDGRSRRRPRPPSQPTNADADANRTETRPRPSALHHGVAAPLCRLQSGGDHAFPRRRSRVAPWTSLIVGKRTLTEELSPMPVQRRGDVTGGQAS